MQPMRLTHVHIRNVLGTEDLEFTPGAFTVIEGPNGSGKTSALEAIRAVAKGGEDATLLRRGENEGEIVLLFDDNTRIRKRVGPKHQPVSITDPDGNHKGGPQTVIRALTDAISLNPVEFLRAPARKRVDVLLESLPMTADVEKIRAIVGDPNFPVTGDHALKQIDHAYQTIFDERTGTNRAARDKEATISQLAAALPPADTSESVVGSDEAELRSKLADIDAAERSEMERIATKLDGIRTEHEAKVGGMRDEIARLQAEIAKESEAFASIQSKAAVQRSLSSSDFAAQRVPLQAAIQRIEGDREASIRAKQTRETITRMEAEAEALRQTGRQQTQALDNLLQYKSDLLAALPVDGLEVKDGEIYRHGVPFDRLNKAQQVEIAIEIAKLRAGEMSLVCVDDLEMLDTEHFEALREQALASGLQLIVTRVSDGKFSVRSEG